MNAKSYKNVYQLTLESIDLPTWVKCGGTHRNFTRGRIWYRYSGYYANSETCDWYLYPPWEFSSVCEILR